MSNNEENSSASSPSKTIQYEIALEEQILEEQAQEMVETDYDEDVESSSMGDSDDSSDDFRGRNLCCIEK